MTRQEAQLQEYVERHWGPGFLTRWGRPASEWVSLSKEEKAGYLAFSWDPAVAPAPRPRLGKNHEKLIIGLLVLAAAVGGATSVVLIILAWLVIEAVRRART